MKCLIIAAGKGSRLWRRGDSKPLLPILMSIVCTLDTVQNMHSHFSRLASSYRQVRTTDVEPIPFIGETLKGLPEVKAADVGCGDGRYDILILLSL